MALLLPSQLPELRQSTPQIELTHRSLSLLPLMAPALEVLWKRDHLVSIEDTSLSARCHKCRTINLTRNRLQIIMCRKRTQDIRLNLSMHHLAAHHTLLNKQPRLPNNHLQIYIPRHSRLITLVDFSLQTRMHQSNRLPNRTLDMNLQILVAMNRQLLVVMNHHLEATNPHPTVISLTRSQILLLTPKTRKSLLWTMMMMFQEHPHHRRKPKRKKTGKRTKLSGKPQKQMVSTNFPLSFPLLTNPTSPKIFCSTRKERLGPRRLVR